MFLENVKHIKKIDKGNVFKHIKERIIETGYHIDDNQVFELSPHQFGIPQHRERVIFVCIRNDIYDISKSIIISPPNTHININLFLETNTHPKYNISQEIEDILNCWNVMINIIETGDSLSPTIMCNEFYKTYTLDEFSNLPVWKKDYIKKNKPLYEKYKSQWDIWYNENKNIITKKEIYGKLEWQTGKKKKNDSIWNYFIQLRQSGIRVKKNDFFPALVAIVQTPIYAKEKRYITPRECARLQSFPDTFILHESDNISYKQLGNAVNVEIIHFVIYKVLLAYRILS
jgi:DNA (cytosine-5)-methyltransferase 1